MKHRTENIYVMPDEKHYIREIYIEEIDHPVWPLRMFYNVYHKEWFWFLRREEVYDRSVYLRGSAKANKWVNESDGSHVETHQCGFSHWFSLQSICRDVMGPIWDERKRLSVLKELGRPE